MDHTTHGHGPDHDHPDREASRLGGHEPNLVNFRAFGIFAGLLIAIAIAVHFTLGAMMSDYAAIQDRTAAPPPQYADMRGQFPEPRPQVAPSLDMDELRAKENVHLASYGWSDRRAGFARIPIARALELVTKKGLPAWKAAEAPSKAPAKAEEKGKP